MGRSPEWKMITQRCLIVCLCLPVCPVRGLETTNQSKMLCWTWWRIICTILSRAHASDVREAFVMGTSHSQAFPWWPQVVLDNTTKPVFVLIPSLTLCFWTTGIPAGTGQCPWALGIRRGTETALGFPNPFRDLKKIESRPNSGLNWLLE